MLKQINYKVRLPNMAPCLIWTPGQSRKYTALPSGKKYMLFLYVTDECGRKSSTIKAKIKKFRAKNENQKVNCFFLSAVF